MNIVQRAWEDWSSTLFLGTLDEQLPEKQKGVDRRGFEWHYWQRKFASGHKTIKGADRPLRRGVQPRWLAYRLRRFGFTVNLWDVVTGQKTLTLEGNLSTVTGVAFSPDGSRIASAAGPDGDDLGRGDRPGDTQD